MLSVKKKLKCTNAELISAFEDKIFKKMSLKKKKIMTFIENPGIEGGSSLIGTPAEQSKKERDPPSQELSTVGRPMGC